MQTSRLNARAAANAHVAWMMTRAHGLSGSHAAEMTSDRRAAATTTGRHAAEMKSGPPPLASLLANSAPTPASLVKAAGRWTATSAAVGDVAAVAVAGDEDAARMTV